MAPVTKLPYSYVTDFTALFKKYLLNFTSNVTNRLFTCCLQNLLDLLTLVQMQSMVKYGEPQHISPATVDMISALKIEISQMRQTITSEILDKQEKEILIDMMKKVFDCCFTSPYMCKEEEENYCRILRFAHLFSITDQEIDAIIRLVPCFDKNTEIAMKLDKMVI